MEIRTNEEAGALTRRRRIRTSVQNRSRRPESKTPSRRLFRTIHEDRSTLPPGTMATAARDDLSWETRASTSATAESACEDDWEEQVSPAKPGAEKHLPSGAGGQVKQ